MQGYVTRLSKLLLSVGQETNGPAARQLAQLKQEFCCLHAVKTRVSPRDWSRFYNWPSVQTQDMEGWAVATTTPDWLDLVVRNPSVPHCNADSTLYLY